MGKLLVSIVKDEITSKDEIVSLTLTYWILVAVMILGAIGSAIPHFPGTSMILGAILIWSVATGFAGVGFPLIAIFVVLILGAAIEYLAIYWGAEKVGASSWSKFGAIVGMVVGLLGFIPALPIGGPIFGLLFGAIVGAFLGEFCYRGSLQWGDRFKQSAKVCIGIVVGSIVGNLIEAFLSIVAVVIFIWNTYPPIG
jgi:uncharacterized protein